MDYITSTSTNQHEFERKSTLGHKEFGAIYGAYAALIAILGFLGSYYHNFDAHSLPSIISGWIGAAIMALAAYKCGLQGDYRGVLIGRKASAALLVVFMVQFFSSPSRQDADRHKLFMAEGVATMFVTISSWTSEKICKDD
eukprot:gnl/MRDRNA2_/MRDRNA2_105283_c0_seq1.p1 gnl/MRDRNA2_/MRDRNA2_105283_c0~~gnl/MRDRNA2_/MRDRNA2_105283_c0_seq1.p1  ORF type:complete len:141 (-),score=18.21 gnl/MRDRNA2_/MRDRNA2_105283_c0_seq1:38-460(-)